MIKAHLVKNMLVGMLGLFLASAAMAADINTRIFEFQQKLAQSGNVQAQFKLAFMYEVGRGVTRDISQAKVWYQKSADQNYTAATQRLRFLDITEKGFKSSDKSWLNLVSDEANNGDSESMFIMAELYESGTGVVQDLEKARHYYKLSTAKGNPNAEARLYKIEQVIFKNNKQQTQSVNTARKAAEERREAARQAELEASKAEEQKLREQEQRAEQEKKRLAAERRKIEEEKRKLEIQKQALAKREAEAAKAKAEKERIAEEQAAQARAKAKKEEVFEADNCSGAAARFRTQCN